MDHTQNSQLFWKCMTFFMFYMKIWQFFTYVKLAVEYRPD